MVRFHVILVHLCHMEGMKEQKKNDRQQCVKHVDITIDLTTASVLHYFNLMMTSYDSRLSSEYQYCIEMLFCIFLLCN